MDSSFSKIAPIVLLVVVVVLLGAVLLKNRGICYDCEETTVGTAENATFTAYLKKHVGDSVNVKMQGESGGNTGQMKEVQAGYVSLDNGIVIPVQKILLIRERGPEALEITLK